MSFKDEKGILVSKQCPVANFIRWRYVENKNNAKKDKEQDKLNRQVGLVAKENQKVSEFVDWQGLSSDGVECKSHWVVWWLNLSCDRRPSFWGLDWKNAQSLVLRSVPKVQPTEGPDKLKNDCEAVSQVNHAVSQLSCSLMLWFEGNAKRLDSKTLQKWRMLWMERVSWR